MSCLHDVLQLDVSPFAALAGYSRPTEQKRAAAEILSGRAPKGISLPSVQTFPAPLVLPHDDLNYDPDWEPQSARSWHNEKERNKLSNRDRRTLYIARVPNIGNAVRFMKDWTAPCRIPRDQNQSYNDNASPPAEMFVDYLKAFYHGMNVELFSEELSWTDWIKPRQHRRVERLPKYVGLAHRGETTRVRVREAPDGMFPAQLNLNDIIDALINLLPKDAYSILLLVDHDIYEGDDDDFCCGRAYGGSRVAVVQTARYNPALDTIEKIDRNHMWPLSHCKEFVDELCAVEEVEPVKATKEQIALSKNGPMKSAVLAAISKPEATSTRNEEMALWFSRLSRTVSHELGHCFGMDHCVYYACNMQGTAGMKEDVRQPPYLCPVCESKVGHAISRELQGKDPKDKDAWIKDRLSALVEFCEQLESSGISSAMWRGLHAWAIGRRAN